MEIEVLNIDDLIPYENNAKEHPKEQIEQIKKSIIEFNNNDPIAIDENNIIIEGHGRHEALKQLGYEQVECIRLSHLNEEQKKAYRLIHNKLTMNSDYDFNLLEQELMNIQDIDMLEFDFDMSFLNEDEEEIKEEAFKNDQKPLLMTYGCGAFSLNLQFCNEIVYSSINFEYSKLEQSKYRIKRLGQERDIKYTYILTDLGITDLVLENIRKKSTLDNLIKQKLQKEGTKWIKDI